MQLRCPLWAISGHFRDVATALLLMDSEREFGLVQWARYAIAAIEPGLLPTINASSSFTRYRKGVSPVASPDFFLPLTWPQMTSKGWPNLFSLVARSIENSADAGFSIFAATVILLFSEQDRVSLRADQLRGPRFSRSRSLPCSEQDCMSGTVHQLPGPLFSPRLCSVLFSEQDRVAPKCAAGGISDSMVVREFGFPSTGPAALGGLAAVVSPLSQLC